MQILCWMVNMVYFCDFQVSVSGIYRDYRVQTVVLAVY